MSAMHTVHTRKVLLTGLLLAGLSNQMSPVVASELTEPEISPPLINTSEKSPLYKLDHNGSRLPEDSLQWQCVEDSSTSLFWQKRDPSSALHDTNETYSWFQPEHDQPGHSHSNPALPGFDSSCFGYQPDDPGSYCNTHAFINRVNQSNYCGYSDWRLPTAQEMLTLPDQQYAYRPNQLSLNINYFPHHDHHAYWTSTVTESGVVITIIKDTKVLGNAEKSDHLLVRLVRGQLTTD